MYVADMRASIKSLTYRLHVAVNLDIIIFVRALLLLAILHVL